MDFCRTCKTLTKNIGAPSFVKNKKHYRRISTCRLCNRLKNNVSKSPKELELIELFKPARKNFETRHYEQFGIDDIWQADLYCFYRPKGNLEDPNYSFRNKRKEIPESVFKNIVKLNNGYKYILNVIDTFSKYVWSIPLKTKSGIDVTEGFKSIFESSKRIPNKLQTDNGKEFYNKHLLDLLKKYNVRLYSTFSDKKASIVERFNRTLGNKLKPLIYKDRRWYDSLPKIIQSYNNSYHRTIKMKPNEVNKYNELDILLSVYNYAKTNNNPKFEVNDRVRLSRFAIVFQNKFKNNWTVNIYTIEKVSKLNINYYKINDIEGTFYEEELQLTKL